MPNKRSKIKIFRIDRKNWYAEYFYNHLAKNYLVSVYKKNENIPYTHFSIFKEELNRFSIDFFIKRMLYRLNNFYEKDIYIKRYAKHFSIPIEEVSMDQREFARKYL